LKIFDKPRTKITCFRSILHVLFVILSLQINIVSRTEAQETQNAFPSGRTLEDFFSSAISFNPKLKAAKGQLDASSARLDFATGQLLPQISANATLSDNRRTSLNQLQEFDGNRYAVQLRQVLFNWQAFEERSAANLRQEIAEVTYFGELSALLASVSDRYFDLLLAYDSLASISAELEAVNNQLHQIEQLYSKQLAKITDLYQAQASAAAIESQKIQLESEVAIRAEALAAISGLNPVNIFTLKADIILPLPKENLHYWLTEAKKNSYSIQASALGVNVAEKNISSRRGAQLPRVDLILQRQDSDVGFDNMPMNRIDNSYIGLDIRVPLYAGGSARAGIREAISLREIATSELQQTELETNQKIRSAYLQLQASTTVISAADRFLDSAELSSTAMQRGFELNAVTSVDVLNALRDRFRAERDLQEAKYNHIRVYLL
jgi:outer membrane protein